MRALGDNHLEDRRRTHLCFPHFYLSYIQFGNTPLTAHVWALLSRLVVQVAQTHTHSCFPVWITRTCEGVQAKCTHWLTHWTIARKALVNIERQFTHTPAEWIQRPSAAFKWPSESVMSAELRFVYARRAILPHKKRSLCSRSDGRMKFSPSEEAAKWYSHFSNLKTRIIQSEKFSQKNLSGWNERWFEKTFSSSNSEHIESIFSKYYSMLDRRNSFGLFAQRTTTNKLLRRNCHRLPLVQVSVGKPSEILRRPGWHTIWLRLCKVDQI